ncbi:hypothetical protein [Plantactinospora endophytica]|uniref:hypothetical protein n=1 Tax=Plantactinospora endophytica TaxID=673535 RepID=UPI00194457C2|nr:hypothetical protein [Plantactinospora endophytica]
MPTDIYGFLEVRHPYPYDSAASWICSMDLAPLHDGMDYAALGCLFGVRNWLSWKPAAADRGLPPDVSATVRDDYEKWSRLDGAIHGATWVSWAELRDLDLSDPAPGRGVLEIQERPRVDHPEYDRWPAGNPEWHGLRRRIRIGDEWPNDVVEAYGVPPVGSTPADASPGCWATADARFQYDSWTRQDVIGPGTGWEHLFNVMYAPSDSASAMTGYVWSSGSTSTIASDSEECTSYVRAAWQAPGYVRTAGTPANVNHSTGQDSQDQLSGSAADRAPVSAAAGRGHSRRASARRPTADPTRG